MIMSVFRIYLFILVFASVDLSIGAVIRAYTNETGTNEQGLYSVDEDVEILNVNNFNKTVFNNDRAWMVEFYSNWCGYCQRSAPKYKAFASSVRNWKDIVGIGAIDCANDDNAVVCTEFGITRYPTFRYFYQHYPEGPTNVGLSIPTDSRTSHIEHRKHLVELMVKDQKEGRGKQFPNLLPFTYSDVSEIFKSAGAAYGFLIIQDQSDVIGPTVTLDFHNVKEVVVRYSFSNDSYREGHLFSVLYAIENNNSPQFLSSFPSDRDHFRSGILQYLKSKNINVPDDGYINTDDIDITNNKSSNDTMTQKINDMANSVFQVDLESTLRYSLKREVGGVKEITGDKKIALEQYLDVLLNYFPIGPNGKLLLTRIKQYIMTNDTVNGTTISTMVRNAEKPGAQVFSSTQQWLACKGSSATFRGYPCGVWKMFHYLTMNAADCNSTITESDPKVVLKAMHGYIQNFFGCEDCSNHFINMSEARAIFNVSSHNESVLWLWGAHNEVNQRLAGDATEDPAYPKIQYPSEVHCPSCYYSDGSWNEAEVLDYLKQVYCYKNIKYTGADPQVLHLTTTSSGIYRANSNMFAVMAGLTILLGWQVLQA